MYPFKFLCNCHFYDEAQSVLLLSHFCSCDVIQISEKKGRGEENLYDVTGIKVTHSKIDDLYICPPNIILELFRLLFILYSWQQSFYISFQTVFIYCILFLGHYDRQKLSLPGSTTSQRRATIMSRSSEHINSLRSSAAYEMTAVSDYLNGHGTPLHMRSTPEIVTKIDVEVRLYLFLCCLYI